MLSGVYVGMPDCYKKAISEKTVQNVLSDSSAAGTQNPSNEGNVDPVSDLEMPKRQEHVAKKGRRR